MQKSVLNLHWVCKKGKKLLATAWAKVSAKKQRKKEQESQATGPYKTKQKTQTPQTKSKQKMARWNLV